MRALAYERRRLLGLRSTWLILAGALCASAAVAALGARQAAPGVLSPDEAVRLVTAAVPRLPVQLTALAAGVLGALATADEVRRPGLTASQVRWVARLRLLVGKLVLIGAAAAVLAVLTLLLDTVAAWSALPPGTSTPRSLAPDLIRADRHLLLTLAAFLVVTVATGWTGVLATALTRSAIAGLLLVAALPTLVSALIVPSVLELLRRAGSLASPFAVSQVTAVAEPLAPALLLFAACLLVQARRRSF
ncbi:hypothetical protein GCM10009665_52260 [Kitasatospora nipponensis]|uniref:ABC-2 family transporter n=1 Tax=Kitasatospora nipponensis TaxID=258049 RepID=A0ABN1WQN6_9ACTN